MLSQKIVVLTDLHMVVAGKTILDMDPAVRLNAAIAHINKTVPDAAHVIITGDLTHWGNESAYIRLRDTLKNLNAPLTLTLGNHDRRDAFFKIFSHSPRDDNGFAQSVLDVGNYRLIILDTLDDTGEGQPPRHHGLLCDQRRAFLAQKLDEAKGRPVVIFMHHPPHDVGFVGMDCIKLWDGEGFYDLIQKHGNVRQIICGHVHRSISGSHRGVPFAIFKSTVDQQPFDFTITNTKLSVNEPGEFGILLLGEQGVRVHAEDF